MDAAHLWQKAATYRRPAQTLSVTNPGRFALLEIAEGFERNARAASLSSNLARDDQAQQK